MKNSSNLLENNQDNVLNLIALILSFKVISSVQTEELTLYVIELEKKNDLLNERINRMEH